MRKPKPTTNTFLLDVYESARAQGWESQQCAVLLREGKLNWKDDAAIKPVAFEFRLGHIAGYLGLDSREKALAVAKVPAKARTGSQQLAYRAAVSAWSHVKLMAGVPNARTGETRTPRAVAARGTTTNGSVVRGAAAPISSLTSPQALLPIVSKVFPRVVAREDVATFALWVVDTIEAFEKRNANVKMGDYRSIFNDFIGSVKAAQKEAAKIAA